jgi:hypothetical protein
MIRSLPFTTESASGFGDTTKKIGPIVSALAK